MTNWQLVELEKIAERYLPESCEYRLESASLTFLLLVFILQMMPE
jgi:hypothetical protein